MKVYYFFWWIIYFNLIFFLSFKIIKASCVIGNIGIGGGVIFYYDEVNNQCYESQIGDNVYFDSLPKFSQIKVFFDNNRSSFYGRTALNQVGEFRLKIKTDLSDFSSSAFLLQQGDQILISSTDDLTTYQSFLIDNVYNQEILNLTTPLTIESNLEDFNVIASQSGVLRVGFSLDRAINDGKIRILIPAVANPILAKDSIPDFDGFDYGLGDDIIVTCPESQDGLIFNQFGIASASALMLNDRSYHIFTCSYTGSGVGDFTSNPILIGTKNGEGNEKRLINPLNFEFLESKKIFFLVQLLNSDNDAIFSTPLPILVNSAVSVKASILPHLTFKLFGKNKGDISCGQSLDVGSLATMIDFGVLPLNQLTKTAINLQVSTNASSGYVITLRQSDQMGLDGQSCKLSANQTNARCIPDALVSGMSVDNSALWEDFNSQYGLAYTLANVNNDQAIFNYTQGFRHLPNLSLAQSPVLIAKNTTTTHQDSIDVCFGLNPSPSNIAGIYENQVFYTVTAGF